MNQVVELKPQAIVHDTGRMSVPDVIRHVTAVQEVMKAVMKEGAHYGTIPGAGDKPTLFKQGAEKLCLAFRVGDDYRIEDLSTPEVSRYRVTCIGIHQPTGTVLGQGIGECSSAEEKYKWRKAVCKEEFEGTPPNMRRIKYGKGKGGSFYTVEQVRTEPADVANTILKMAGKRAKVAMTLNVTAAGDMFSQDLEDLDDVLREHLTEDERQSSLQLNRDAWAQAVAEAQTEDALKRIVKEAVPTFQKSKDTEGYKEFRALVQARGAEVKKPPPPAPASAPTSGPAEDPFVREMNATEGERHA